MLKPLLIINVAMETQLFHLLNLVKLKTKPLMVEICGLVCGCGSLVLDLSRINVNC
jgi:hypothetical protein